MMVTMKNETPFLKKAKKVYTIELAIFTLIFLVLGILILVDVIPLRGTFRKVLIYVSIAGSLWLLADFFWTCFSKKRRAKNSLFDKLLALPAGIAVLVLDILTFVIGFEESNQLHETFVGILFCYLAAAYVAQIVYHWFRPLPMLIEGAREEEEEAKNASAEEVKEEGDELKALLHRKKSSEAAEDVKEDEPKDTETVTESTVSDNQIIEGK